MRPVAPLEPVGGLAHAQRVRADLGIEVARQRQPRRAGDRRAAQPAGDAADAHQVGHVEVGGLRLHRAPEAARTVEVLADLDRRLQLARELRRAFEVVELDRLLEPLQPLVVECVQAQQRLAAVEALVEVGPQPHLGADRLAHDAHRLQVGRERRAPEAHLDRAKPALLNQPARLGRQLTGRQQPQAVGVVGAHRPDAAAQAHRQRLVRGLRERVPDRHVEPGRRDQADAFTPVQLQRVHAAAEGVDRRQRRVGQALGGGLDGRHDVACGAKDVRLEVGAADDALVRAQVDQDERPLGEAADYRVADDRAAQRRGDDAQG